MKYALTLILLAGCASIPEKPVVDKRTKIVLWQTKNGTLYEDAAGRGSWVVTNYGTIFYSGKPSVN